MSREAGEGEASDWVRRERIWNQLWKLKVPDGLKILAWRLFHNALPVFRNLSKWGIGDKRECSLCGFEDESAGHLFLDCWWAKSFWNAFGIDLRNVESAMNPSDWLWRILAEGNRNSIINVILGIFVVWKNRNRVVHGQVGWTVESCLFIAKSLKAQFETRQLQGLNGIQCREEQGNGVWMILCDGSWNPKDRKGGWAAVAINKGMIMGCKVEFMDGCLSGLQAEVNGIVAGLRLASRFECELVSICSDCVEAIWAVQGGKGHEFLDAALLLDCSKILSANPSWKLQHVFRDDNRGVDFLAKRARMEEWSWDNYVANPIFPRGIWTKIQEELVIS